MKKCGKGCTACPYIKEGKSVIEQSKRTNNLYRKETEEYHINRFNTFYKGLNKKKKYWGGEALYCLHNCK